MQRPNWEIAWRPEPAGVLRGRERVYVSLNRRGEIAFNDTAWREILRPFQVAVIFDRGRRYLGVKFPVARDRHFFPTRGYGRDRKMRIVRASAAIKQFGLGVAETLVFKDVRVIRVNDEPTLLLDLENLKRGKYFLQS